MKPCARHTLLPLLAVLALSPVTALAQTIPSPYDFVDERQSFNIFAGYIATDAGRTDLGPRSSAAFGARYSIRLSGPFTAEAGASLIPTTRMVYDTTDVGDPLETVGEADMTIGLFDIALRFNVTGPRTYRNLQPYVLAGLGIGYDFSGSSGIEADLDPSARFEYGTRFAGQIGAGVEWFVLRRIALRADARDVFWRLNTPQAILQQDLDLPSREWVQNYVVSLGVSYHF